MAPKMFEARAMAQGNRCMNYTVGIAYPVFTVTVAGKTTIQKSDPVVSVEGSTPLNDANVQTDRIDVGLSTIGVARKIAESQAATDTGPKTNPGSGPETPMDPKVPGAPLTPSPTPVVPPGSGA